MIELPGVQQIGSSPSTRIKKACQSSSAFFLTYTFTAYYYPVRMHAAGVESSVSLSVCLSVCQSVRSSLSSESLVEGLVQNRSVRIQHLHNLQTRDPLERLRKFARKSTISPDLIYTT